MQCMSARDKAGALWALLELHSIEGRNARGTGCRPWRRKMLCRMLTRDTRMPYSDDSNRCRQGRPTGTLTVPRSPPSRPSPTAAGHKPPQVLGQGVRPSVPASSAGCSWPGRSLSSGFGLFPRPGLSVCPLSLDLSALLSLWLGHQALVQTERESESQPRQTASLSFALRPPLQSALATSLFFSFLSFLSADFFSHLLQPSHQSPKPQSQLLSQEGERRVARAH